MGNYLPDGAVLGDILEQRAASHGNRTFLQFREGNLTYGEVDEMANRVARGLAACGVRQHHHVAVMLPNCPEFLYVIFALAKLGAVAVPVNTAYKGDLLHHVLESADVSLLVVDEPLLDRVARVEGRAGKLSAVVVRAAGGLGSAGAGVGGMGAADAATGAAGVGLRTPARWLHDLLNHGAEPPRVAVRHSDLQAIMYTSGTTGPSKGVMVPHTLALTCAEDSIRYLGYRPDEVIYCSLPLFHAAGLWDGMMVALLLGSSIAIVERFSASRFWADVRRFNANVAMSVQSMIPILLNQPPTPDDKNHPLRAFYMGKSALDEAFTARFGVRSVETYTSTEVGIGTGSPYGQWRVGSCGQENSLRYEVKVVDPWDREVGPGEPGELVVRPKQPFIITTGYYNFPQATADCFRNLWFHTGDLAYRDQDGYFYFLERIKDTIRRRGENISAFEVERTINNHPSVLESAAFAVPSELEEDEIKVAVVLRPRATLEPAELIAHCQERLPGFMVPRFIEFVGELPRNTVGKVAKHELRAQGNQGITARTWDRERAGFAAAGRES